MRRSLSALVLGVSLFLGSVGWASFTITRTALDPSRSEELADQMFENPELRGAMVGVLADRLEDLLPPGVAVSRRQLEDVADRTLDDPAVALLVRDGLVEIHRKALTGDDTDTVLHATAVGTAARNVLVADRPELEAVLPQAPALRVALPTAGLSFLGPVRDALGQAGLIAGLLAGAGTVLALTVTRDRPMVLRRVSVWAFGTAGFWLILALGIPRLVSSLAPTQGMITGAIASVMFGSMVPGALTLLGAGAAMLCASAAWTLHARRRGARLVGRANFAR